MNGSFVKSLKGGSLASTDVIEEGGKQVVLKKISLIDNREYGYYRWQSQLRMLISFSNRWPRLFPKILNYGVNDSYAFYTIPYYEGWLNAYEYLQQNNISPGQLQKLADKILSGIGNLHAEDYGVIARAWELYYAEEVRYAMNSIPQSILERETVTYNGQDHASLLLNRQRFYDIGKAILTNIGHSEVHGNLTLENIIVSPNLDLMFIDPYFEVGVGTPLGDYAQLLQSSDANYELIMAQFNNGKYALTGNCVLNLKVEKNPQVKFINRIFINFVNNLGCETYFKVRWLEVSQFIRMLPFKFSSDQNAGMMIYIYTCHLVDKFIGEFNELKPNL